MRESWSRFSPSRTTPFEFLLFILANSVDYYFRSIRVFSPMTLFPQSLTQINVTNVAERTQSARTLFARAKIENKTSFTPLTWIRMFQFDINPSKQVFERIKIYFIFLCPWKNFSCFGWQKKLNRCRNWPRCSVRLWTDTAEKIHTLCFRVLRAKVKYHRRSLSRSLPSRTHTSTSVWRSVISVIRFMCEAIRYTADQHVSLECVCAQLWRYALWRRSLDNNGIQ